MTLRSDLAILIPRTCARSQLTSIVTRLLRQGAAFLTMIHCELILIDSLPNAGNRIAAEKIAMASPKSMRLDCVETDVDGVTTKIRLGLECCIAAPTLFLGDEAVAIYDFPRETFEIASAALSRFRGGADRVFAAPVGLSST